MTDTLYSKIGNKPLAEIFEDWRPQDLDLTEDWLDVPPADFLSYVRDRPNSSLWSIPPSDNYRKQPNFLISQAHRAWISMALTREFLSPQANLLDFGSYPFVVPIILREYMKFSGGVTATVIQPLSDTERDELSSLQIETAPLDLDPHVVDPKRSGSLPTELPHAPGSFDVATLFHVIEHLYHPMDTLREARRLLRTGGRLLITTDNASMLNVFLNVVSGYGYVFEPVETTAAMQIDDWRGHVRFFTERDLTIMLEKSGFVVEDVRYREIFYDVFFDDYYSKPKPALGGWKIPIIRDNPQFRNDIMVVARAI